MINFRGLRGYLGMWLQLFFKVLSLKNILKYYFFIFKIFFKTQKQTLIIYQARRKASNVKQPEENIWTD